MNIQIFGTKKCSTPERVMKYIAEYTSPLGLMRMTADEQGLTGLWFEAKNRYGRPVTDEYLSQDMPAFTAARRWLDIYFSGGEPDFDLPLHLIGSDFQKEVWEILLHIPYGQVRTYGDIAAELAARRGLAKMSAQAVGGAVGHNQLLIVVPCHRVVGSGGNLTGFGGGIDTKIHLLEREGLDMTQFYVPKKGTAL